MEIDTPENTQQDVIESMEIRNSVIPQHSLEESSEEIARGANDLAPHGTSLQSLCGRQRQWQKGIK